MEINLPVDLLKLVVRGILEVSENNKKSLRFSFKKNVIIIDLLEIEFNIPTSKGIFTRLSEARDFARNLKKMGLTLCIAHNGRMVMKLGQGAKPKFSRLITQSESVEIIDLRELRRLDKRLRLK